MRNVIWGAALVAVMAGCGDGMGPEAGLDVALVGSASELTLRRGEERIVPGSLLRVGFSDMVQDSRCPIDAVCVWEGDAVAEITLTAGTGPTTTLRLHTPQQPSSAEWQGVRVTLTELLPAPRASEPTREEDYAVRLKVEPIGR